MPFSLGWHHLSQRNQPVGKTSRRNHRTSWSTLYTSDMGTWILQDILNYLDHIYIYIYIYIDRYVYVYVYVYIYIYISRVRSKGSRFTLGSGGWGCVRSTLRNVWGPYGRAYGEFCKSGHWSLLGFQTSRSLVSRGRRGTLWHSNMFHSASQFLLCGTRNTFASFSEDELHFWETSMVLLRGRRQAQHFRRVVLRVLCKSHCRGCVKWWQRANSVAGVAFCEMWWKWTEAWHETSILR